MDSTHTMKTVKIKWVEDSYECDTCGSSYATGAQVNIDDKIDFVLEPIAHCYDGVIFDDRDVFERILLELGYKVEYV